MTQIHHRFAEVDGRQLYYREAGPADAPVIVLLHGFPASSFMFRRLIPMLADRWHVIAPDLLGFGHSDMPLVDEFDYSFEALTDLTQELLDRLGVGRFAMYVQDYGAPIGWRLALRRPEAVTAIVSQSGNAYDDGLNEAFFETQRGYWREQTRETEAVARQALTLEATRWQYVTGVADESVVDPDTWEGDYGLLTRPGSDRVQLRLFADYATNIDLYPDVQRYFRESQVPLLAVWGRNDPVFDPAGAEAFVKDLPRAEVHLLDGGHFLLESALDEVVPILRAFFTDRLRNE
ncbi:alpha/beta hydrolase [Kineosporia sp. NBRC 101731]|uniref:alpha/beta fold hydrolase n=1 Tax=Kineosporia sp. NBRC 101731 TaxID=3032199 RepID=UPI0024A0DF1C|nr:alpha/beta hydrolase [Kineosporia sp. NBRC 101731]GLY28865.1 hydrolase [Kineosporia sp. NBRC 101731]